METKVATPELELYGIYEVEVVIRSQLAGRPVKPQAMVLNGQKHFLEVLWKMNNDDPYPGEFAMGDASAAITVGRNTLFKQAKLGWIASGDVKIIREVSREEYQTILEQEIKNDGHAPARSPG